jgi:hypothetical protein
MMASRVSCGLGKWDGLGKGDEDIYIVAGHANAMRLNECRRAERDLRVVGTQSFGNGCVTGSSHMMQLHLVESDCECRRSGCSKKTEV